MAYPIGAGAVSGCPRPQLVPEAGTRDQARDQLCPGEKPTGVGADERPHRTATAVDDRHLACEAAVQPFPLVEGQPARIVAFEFSHPEPKSFPPIFEVKIEAHRVVAHHGLF